jgi:hypothetical protein
VVLDGSYACLADVEGGLVILRSATLDYRIYLPAFRRGP